MKSTNVIHLGDKRLTKLAAIFILTTIISCQNAGNKSEKKAPLEAGIPEFAFQEEFHNFGNLQDGEVVAYSFSFTNSGNGSLSIEKIEKDCGCLEVNFPRYAIAPEASDFIEVVFNSSGETGRVYKELVIFSNTVEQKTKLAIGATVKNEIINLYSKN